MNSSDGEFSDNIDASSDISSELPTTYHSTNLNSCHGNGSVQHAASQSIWNTKVGPNDVRFINNKLINIQSTNY
jgi:hypothetical protein